MRSRLLALMMGVLLCLMKIPNTKAVAREEDKMKKDKVMPKGSVKERKFSFLGRHLSLFLFGN